MIETLDQNQINYLAWMVLDVPPWKVDDATIARLEKVSEVEIMRLLSMKGRN